MVVPRIAWISSKDALLLGCWRSRYTYTSTPQLPFKIPHIPTDRDHRALNRGTLWDLGTHRLSMLGIVIMVLVRYCTVPYFGTWTVKERKASACSWTTSEPPYCYAYHTNGFNGYCANEYGCGSKNFLSQSPTSIAARSARRISASTHGVRTYVPSTSKDLQNQCFGFQNPVV